MSTFLWEQCLFCILYFDGKDTSLDSETKNKQVYSRGAIRTLALKAKPHRVCDHTWAADLCGLCV